jgi:hypothetical protein
VRLEARPNIKTTLARRLAVLMSLQSRSEKGLKGTQKDSTSRDESGVYGEGEPP